MVNIKTLLPDLKKLVQELDEDLLVRATENAEIDAGLRGAFSQIVKGGRTAQAFEVWREDYLDQVAVAWVLACVFVRFTEDNHLIDDCWLAGEGDRRRLAEDTHEIFFRKHPHETDREYFHHVFHEVGKIPAAKDLFAEGKTPLWAVSPSGDAAMKLLAFWREIDAEEGHLKRSFKVEGGDTRFLGDLYQDLSEKAKKKYALLQTPVFVEEFILDRTLDPAIDEFGLDSVREIDPTCGSGHFLLGGFARLFDLWMKRESNEIVAAQKALDGVWGVDINPFAVAIARFRLIVAALVACGIKRLKDAPGWAVHLATGDSLLFGNRWNRSGEKVQEQKWFATDEGSWAPEIYGCEDKDALQEVLGQQYHAVVGNPPYITPKDPASSKEYRKRYKTAYDKYHLSTPFTERFFELALSNRKSPGGFVGLIKDNAFMKRDFGIKLIEGLFPELDLTHVVNTSGAYIPGHGTPTVILFGRNRSPTSDVVRAVLGIKGEPSTPEDASQGLVWQSIVRNIDKVGFQDEFISVADMPRSTFHRHPWSIGGGGATDLMESLESATEETLEDRVDSIGITSFTLEDDVYILPRQSAMRNGIPTRQLREMVVGDMLRDWHGTECDPAVFPYDDEFRPIEEDYQNPLFRYLWAYRNNLANSKMFAEKTKIQSGLRWYEYGRLTHTKLRTPLSIAFAFVATHNHFVLDRGGKVFKQSAPIIKLPAEANEDDHLALLGLLNSSTACFWMKQSFHNKGNEGYQSGIKSEAWEKFYEFTATGLQRFPVANHPPVDLARTLDRLGQEHQESLPDVIVCREVPTAICNDVMERKASNLRGRMISLQEELDWHCYYLYQLLTDKLCYDSEDLPDLTIGQRAFEIAMARRKAKGRLETSWFERHNSTPITDLPCHWSHAYRRLVERRIEIIETNKNIGLIEQPEYERRWNDEPWENQQQRSMRNWLLDRLESPRYWSDRKRLDPSLQSTAQLADRASGDHDFLQVAAIYRGRPDFDVAALVNELVESESVPFLPVLRYKPTGLRKREVWDRTWDDQRKQDSGEDVGDIPVPPKYVTADFLKQDYWRLRGKLDVPKERWISYPYLQTDSDPSLVVGWAGWDHLQQATALVTYYDARRREGWDAKRLTPILAGLDQLLPWIHQWHPEIDAEFGDTAGQSHQTMLEHDAHELGLTLEEIRNWEPPKTTRKDAKTTNRSAGVKKS
jgi:hypothetical protein